MSPSATTLYKKLSSVCRHNTKKDVFAVYSEIAGYLQRNLHPLNSKLVKDLRVLNPKYRDGLADGGKSLVVSAAKEMGQWSSAQIDALDFQWELLDAAKFVREEDEPIDSFLAMCLQNIVDPEQPCKELAEFIRTSLSLPCANASVS